MGNIEEDIKILENYLKDSSYKEKENNFFKGSGWEVVDLEIPQAMANVLTEFKKDKKRIKELEAKLEFKKWGDLDNTQFEEYMSQFVSKQKVKDVIINETIDIFGFECIAVEDLEELVEDK